MKSAESSKSGLKTSNFPESVRRGDWSQSCSYVDMWTLRRARTLGMVLLLPFALLAAAPARVPAGSTQRVRSSSPYLKELIASGVERSPTFRDIVERLETST